MTDDMSNDKSDDRSEETRYQRGLKRLAEVDAQAGAAAVEPLGDLGRYIAEFAYGDIYSRPGLELREREMLTVAILTALGRESQLRLHLRGALNVGVTRRELEEIIIHTVPYAGFPTAINALKILQETAVSTRSCRD